MTDDVVESALAWLTFRTNKRGPRRAAWPALTAPRGRPRRRRRSRWAWGGSTGRCSAPTTRSSAAAQRTRTRPAHARTSYRPPGRAPTPSAVTTRETEQVWRETDIGLVGGELCGHVLEGVGVGRVGGKVVVLSRVRRHLEQAAQNRRLMIQAQGSDSGFRLVKSWSVKVWGAPGLFGAADDARQQAVGAGDARRQRAVAACTHSPHNRVN